MAVQTCPDPLVLKAFWSGTSSDSDVESIAAHLDSCRTCLDDLETISRSPDHLTLAVRRCRNAPPFVPDEAFRRALSSVNRLDALPPREAGVCLKSTPTEPLPTTIDQYRIIEELGRGGMGTVYKAEHMLLRRPVALKVLPSHRMSDPDLVARFLKEMELVAQMDHLHVVKAHDARSHDGRLFIVLQYVDGVDLSKVAERGSPLPVADVCEMLRQAALGLDHAHERGLVHRDLKPSNLLLSTAGRVVVLDFGLARLLGDQPMQFDLTTTGQIMGTIDYIAPEQIRSTRAVDIRADLYSLGATAYRLLTGAAPFSGSAYRTNYDKMTGHVEHAPESIASRRSDVPPELVALIHRLLAKNPAERPGTPAELAELLAPFCSGSNLPALASHVATLTGYGAPSERLPRDRSTDIVAAADTGKSFPAAVPVASPGSLPTGPESADGLHSGRTTPRPAPASAPAIAPPSRTTRRGLAVAAFAAAVVILWGTWVIVRDRNGKETGRLPVPEDGSAELRTAPAAVEETTHSIPALIVDAAPDIKPNAPLSRLALVGRPATVPGARSWTVETRQHRGGILAVAVSPDNRLVATGGQDGALRLWDLPSGKLVRIFVGSDFPIQSIAWSHDTHYLAVVSRESLIEPTRIWEAATGRRVRQLPRTSRVVWSPRALVTAVVTDDRMVELRDMQSGRTVRRWELSEPIGTLAWSLDGRRIAATSLGSQPTVTVLDVESDRPVLITEKAPRPIHRAAWSPDGKALAGTGPKGGLYLWNADTGKLSLGLAEEAGHAGVSSDLAWLTNGSIVFVDAFLRQWDITSRKIRVEFGALGVHSCVAASRDGQVVVVADGHGVLKCFVSDSPSPRWVQRGHGLQTGDQCVTWSPDGARIAFVSNRRHERPWQNSVVDVATGNKVAGRPTMEPIQVWNGAGDRLIARQDEHHLAAWALDPAEGPQIVASSHEVFVDPMIVSPDGGWLAAALDGGKVGLWKKGGSEAVRTWSVDNHPFRSIAWSPDSRRLALSGPSGKVFVFDRDLDAPVRTMPAQKEVPQDQVVSVWSPDGATLATASAHFGRVALWETAEGRLIDVLTNLGPASAMTWLPTESNQRCAALLGHDWQCRIYDSSLQETEAGFPGYTFDALSPDGRIMASPELSAVYFWEPRTGRRHGAWTALFNEHALAVNSEGHVRASHEHVDAAISHVVETADGQLTLSPEQFTKSYGWINDPRRVRLVGAAK